MRHRGFFSRGSLPEHREKENDRGSVFFSGLGNLPREKNPLCLMCTRAAAITHLLKGEDGGHIPSTERKGGGPSLIYLKGC